MSSQEEKLEESEYFYAIMMENYNKEMYKNFNHSLSAFLASTRSVLQYTYEYAKTCRRENDYNGLLVGKRTLRYFKDKRDFNIHTGPVKANQVVTLKLHDRLTLRMSDAVKITATYGDGTEETRSYDSQNDIQTEIMPDLPPSERTLSYRFEDWSGTEDVIALAHDYLEELRVFIQDAKRIGLIT